MSDEVQEQPQPQVQPSAVLAAASRRFVVRRAGGGGLEPLVGDSMEDVEARLRRQVAEGGEEVDLYVYVGTFRPKRIAEKIDLFAGDDATV